MRIFFLKFLILALALSLSIANAKQDLNIGVLAFNSKDKTLQDWEPTAKYLESKIDTYKFNIIPLSYGEFEKAIENKQISYFITSPAHFASLETTHGASALATMMFIENAKPNVSFSSVIFTKPYRADISTLADLKGKTIAAVSKESLGGYIAALGELEHIGIKQKDFNTFFTELPHKKVVFYVLDGKADAGIVRTGVIENLIAEGKMTLADIKIINQKTDSNFNFIHSTKLYPEWPFAKLESAPDGESNSIQKALFEMPYNSTEAKAGNYSGWSRPVDYTQMHHLLRVLKLKPYDYSSNFSLKDIAEKYKALLIVLTLCVVLLLFGIYKIFSLYIKLKSEIKQKTEIKESLLDITNTVGDAIYVMDNNGYITYANPKCIELLGWSLEELTSTHSHDLMHHTHSDGTKYHTYDCNIIKSITTKTNYHSDDELFWKKNGSSFFVSVNANPIIKNGVVSGSVVAFQDITENKQNSLKIANLLAEQTAYFESAVIGIAHLTNRVILKTNKIWNEILGYENGELNGKSTRILYLDNYAYDELGIKAYTKMLTDFYQGEQIYVKKDGTPTHIILSGAYIDKNDLSKGSVWTIVDISKQKKLEENLEHLLKEETLKLKESEEVYSLVFNSSTIGIGFASTTGEIINANPSFCKMLDYEPDEILHLTIVDVTHPEDFENEKILLQSLQNGECDSFQLAKRMIRKDRRVIQAETIISVVRNNDGTIKFFYALVEDVTEKNEKLLAQKEQERIVVQQSRMAAMGEMISAIAHQWRQPLNALGIIVQDVVVAHSCGELNEDYVDAFSADSMKQIQFMSKTIDNFREFFKPDKTTEVFLLVDYIEEIISMFRPQFVAYGISIEVLSIAQPRINGLKHEFGQVVLNIINNAKDALLEKDIQNPKIIVDILDTEDESLSIMISDNAGGIPNDVLEKIFDPYFTTKPEGKGTGIGLYISKIIIESHMKGKLIATNGKEGAVFDIKLSKNIATH